MISLSSKMVEDAKHKYFSNVGATLPVIGKRTGHLLIRF